MPGSSNSAIKLQSSTPRFEEKTVGFESSSASGTRVESPGLRVPDTRLQLVPYTEAMGAPPWAASLDQAGILQQPNRDDLKSPLKRFQSSTKHFAVAGGEHEQNSRLLNSPPDARRGAAPWHFPVPLPTSRGNHFRAFLAWTVVLRVSTSEYEYDE